MDILLKRPSVHIPLNAQNIHTHSKPPFPDFKIPAALHFRGRWWNCHGWRPGHCAVNFVMSMIYRICLPLVCRCRQLSLQTTNEQTAGLKAPPQRSQPRGEIIIFEKLIVAPLVKRFLTFYGTPKNYYRVQKRSPLSPFLSPKNPVYMFKPISLKFFLIMWRIDPLQGNYSANIIPL